MSGKPKIANAVFGLVGAAAGGTLGYFAFSYLARQGLYAMVLPGTLLGLGCGVASGVRSNALGTASGLLAVLLGVFTEWRFAPFIDDESFGYFIAHLRDLSSGTLVLIGIGGLFAFWFGRGRDRGVWLRRGQSRDKAID